MKTLKKASFLSSAVEATSSFWTDLQISCFLKPLSTMTFNTQEMRHLSLLSLFWWDSACQRAHFSKQFLVHVGKTVLLKDKDTHGDHRLLESEVTDRKPAPLESGRWPALVRWGQFPLPPCCSSAESAGECHAVAWKSSGKALCQKAPGRICLLGRGWPW